MRKIEKQEGIGPVPKAPMPFKVEVKNDYIIRR